MTKSAQSKFNEYLDECRETSQSINDMVDSSYKLFGSYAYATGYLQSLLAEVIDQLPKAKREGLRNRLRRQAQNDKNAQLANKLKEAV
jgi:hypothetical protein